MTGRGGRHRAAGGAAAQAAGDRDPIFSKESSTAIFEREKKRA